MIPFLSPPNQKWPEYLYAGGLNFGNIVKNKTEDGVDFEIMNQNFTGECIDHTRPVSTVTMKEILMRLPETSRIHLVFSEKMQKSYFSKKGYEGFVESHPCLKEIVVYRLVPDSKKEQLKFAKVPGMHHTADSDATRLVVLIATDDLKAWMENVTQYKDPEEKKQRRL
jgi:hypothetical protein